MASITVASKFKVLSPRLKYLNLISIPRASASFSILLAINLLPKELKIKPKMQATMSTSAPTM